GLDALVVGALDALLDAAAFVVHERSPGRERASWWGRQARGKALSKGRTLLKVLEPRMHRGIALDQLAGDIDGVDQRVQREGLHRGRARAGPGGGQHLPLDRLDRADQSGGVV